MDTRVDAWEGEIARLRAETVEYGRLLRKSGAEIGALERRVRELECEVEKEKQTVGVWRDVCKTLAVPFTRTPRLVGRVASCP